MISLGKLKRLQIKLLAPPPPREKGLGVAVRLGQSHSLREVFINHTLAHFKAENPYRVEIKLLGIPFGRDRVKRSR